MQFNRILLALLALLFYASLTAASAYAGDGHDHNHEAAVEPAPHGGMLRDAMPYKVELTMEKDLVRVYIYDRNLQPVSRDRLKETAAGSLAFPRDRSKREVLFTLKDKFYEATIPSISSVHRFDLHVNFFVDGKEIVGDFGVDNIH